MLHFTASRTWKIRPEFCEGPSSPCPHVCPHGCPLMCSYSPVHNNPENPSSDPLPHQHLGSEWGCERLRESKNSARTQQKLFPAHGAWGESPQGQTGVSSWVWETQTEREGPGRGWAGRADQGPGSVLLSGLEVRECQDTRAGQGKEPWGIGDVCPALTGGYGSENRTSTQ